MNSEGLGVIFCYLKQAFAPALLSNWILAAFGIVGAIIAICTLRKLVQQTKAAVVSANAARISVETSRMAERAYVNMSHVPPGITFPASDKIEAVVQIKNNGRTPANITAAVLTFWTELELPEQPPYPREAEGGGFSLPRGDHYFKRHAKTIPLLRLSEVRTGKRPAWLLGYVDYIDTFDRRHRAGYARRYDPRPEALENNLPFETTGGYNYDRERQQGEGNDWPR